MEQFWRPIQQREHPLKSVTPNGRLMERLRRQEIDDCD